VLINPSVAVAAEPTVSLSLTFAGSLNKATAIEATAKQVGCWLTWLCWQQMNVNAAAY
jgi:hypothetical protein